MPEVLTLQNLQDAADDDDSLECCCSTVSAACVCPS